MNRVKRMLCFALVCVLLSLGFVGSAVAAVEGLPETTEELKAKREAAAKAKREAAATAKREAIERAKAKLEEEIAQLSLPEDTSQRYTAKELQISGNTLVSTSELVKKMPLVYNASDKPLREAESNYLYDLRPLLDVILQPGEPREVSARSIQGFIQYVLSIYQEKNYGGIYVYVPEGAIREGVELPDGILPVEVLEAKISDITVSSYDPNGQELEKGYLRSSAVKQWSPVKVGRPANQKELEDFINLLNLNPDRFVSATVSKGTEPKSLAVGYDIYEADPWHWYVQVDNSGTGDRQWAPRVGLINTNLTGTDDRLTVMYQVPLDSRWDDSYSLFGSYDFPLAGPRLRLNVYGGYNEFDIDGGGGITFLGDGSFCGGQFRLNVFQTGGWFFDVTSSLGHERSRVSSSIFATILGSEVSMNLWGAGLDIHRLDDMSNTSLTFNWVTSIGGSSQTAFDDARTGATPRFNIYNVAANHSRYLDPGKVNRLRGSCRWITSNGRLVPAKMTTFGGMYTVRGYAESSIVADGGILASVQYEFDLVKHKESKKAGEAKPGQAPKKPLLRKLAPLVFFDYGHATIINAIPGGEKIAQNLCSVGLGALVELGDNFSGGVYYGWPLTGTDGTNVGDGRFNFSFICRF
jgi:hemolysin activation/secretion protein